MNFDGIYYNKFKRKNFAIFPHFCRYNTSVHVSLDGRFPLSTLEETIFFLLQTRATERYFWMFAYFHGIIWEFFFHSLITKALMQVAHQLFFHTWVFRGLSELWFSSLCDNSYIPFYLMRHEKNSWRRWRHTGGFLYLGENWYVRDLETPLSYTAVCFYCQECMPSYQTFWQIDFIQKKCAIF